MNNDAMFRPKRAPRTSWWINRSREGFTEVAKRECRPLIRVYNNWERDEGSSTN